MPAQQQHTLLVQASASDASTSPHLLLRSSHRRISYQRWKTQRRTTASLSLSLSLSSAAKIPADNAVALVDHWCGEQSKDCTRWWALRSQARGERQRYTALPPRTAHSQPRVPRLLGWSRLETLKF